MYQLAKQVRGTEIQLNTEHVFWRWCKLTSLSLLLFWKMLSLWAQCLAGALRWTCSRPSWTPRRMPPVRTSWFSQPLRLSRWHPQITPMRMDSALLTVSKHVSGARGNTRECSVACSQHKQSFTTVNRTGADQRPPTDARPPWCDSRGTPLYHTVTGQYTVLFWPLSSGDRSDLFQKGHWPIRIQNGTDDKMFFSCCDWLVTSSGQLVC